MSATASTPAPAEPRPWLSLPAARTPRGKVSAGIVCGLVCAALYLAPNRLGGAPGTLPLTALDLAVPFWPASVWLYAAMYGLLGWAFFGTACPRRASRLLYALAFCQVLAAGIYTLIPLRFPREAFALPPGTWGLNRQAIAFWHAIDAPVNCLPSLHVTTALLCLWAFNAAPLRRHRAAALLLATLTIGSTLTFKQHYAVDLLGGAILAALGWALFFSRRVRVA